VGQSAREHRDSVRRRTASLGSILAAAITDHAEMLLPRDLRCARPC
jgi:hypothetical protein